MVTFQQHNAFAKIGLYMGIAVPFMYFGIQLLAAPFFPEYSFLDHAASLLGSDLSTFPALFNIGAILTGIITMIASFGFLGALQKLRVHWFLILLTCTVLLLGALGHIWAGLFPMPDPKHSANPFTIGLFLIPFLLPSVFWTLPNSRTIKRYFLVNILLFGILVLNKSSVIDIGLLNHEGVFQRVFALITFVPIAVSSYGLIKRLEHTHY